MKKNLSANQLKFIAILAMTLDHLAWTLFPGYSTLWYVVLCHIIGRLAAPIMWFFVAEGYHHTRDLNAYTRRLFLLALISHFAYNFCFGIPLIPFRTSVFNQTGVVWSLAWGLVLLRVNGSSRFRPWQKLLIIALVCLITFPADWSCVAAIAVLFLGAYRGDFRRQMYWLFAWILIYALVYFLFIDKFYAVIQLGTALCVPFLCRYSGEKGRFAPMGKLFYAYYPVHLALCGLLRILLHG